ncbi:alpha-galactosidase [Anaerocolumna jejuensis DSM 15929]|uniref:Alpha-galactosidase n=1 Tax=Anaerocolumna jejuensis DSM 15929 TaxID=1121322 RepID=A0A1M6K2P0_9FIRM|nr:glycoside hydrolase family 27 protein [Anaerocolumna jejuensis]SHJ53197.1 alpha-galactosidase [Anaerocolumna jejuensis DSM 15929]
MSILAKTPPMGWNTWNTFGWKINEELVKKAADAFVESGLKDAGYEYIVIDDCWSLKERDEEGRLVCDPEKFPGGMKQLADYVHSKGLKFGMYSCAGTHTCAGHPGSFEHEFEDAKTFAEWGVDYLKYDYCYKPDHIPGEILYKRMGTALRNCGRDILFSACNWGNDEVYQWIRETGAHMFRSTGDIQDNWESIKNIVLSQIGKESHSGTYCYNDMDMLVVGMYGKGDNNAVALGGCSDIEYRSHFSLWALMNSPLMIGCDIRKMSKETVEILTNKDIIALNQDEEARGPYCIRQWNNPEKVMAFVKPLSNGDYAIGMFNFSETASEMSLQFWDIGLSAAAGKGLSIYDCWSHEEEGTFKERYVCTLEPHGCRVFRGKVIDF